MSSVYWWLFKIQWIFNCNSEFFLFIEISYHISKYIFYGGESIKFQWALADRSGIIISNKIDDMAPHCRH